MTVNFYFSKIACLCLFFFLSATGIAQTTYYVSATGSDQAVGTSEASAWKTLKKLNSITYKPGDRILLRRGDVFYGQLKIASNKLIVDAYGKGQKPIISGAEVVNNTWKHRGEGIWEVQIGNKPAQINTLFKNEVLQPISRHPDTDVNNGYLNFESHEGANKFTDKELNDEINWTGTDMIVRSELWRMEKVKVLNHEGQNIEFKQVKSIPRLRDGFGYFFVNDLKAINREGEWAYDQASGKIYLYSTIDPNKSRVSFSLTDTLISVTKAQDLTLKNIKVMYSGKLGISVSRSSGVIIDNAEILYSGGDGIIFNSSTNSALQNTLIADANWSGAFSTKSSNHIKFANNIVRNIGNPAYGKSKTFIGIDCNSSFSELLNNRVNNTGYAGIIACGENNLVKRNIVDGVCRILEDMGGIYTNNNINNTTGTIIEENIVMNSSCLPGGGAGEHSLANGIYLDNRSQGVTVRNNTVAFVDGSGIFIHSTLRDNKIYDNTSFQSGYSEFYITNPDTLPQYDVQRNILVSNNPAEDHLVFLIGKTNKYTFHEIGLFKNNHIINPFHAKIVKVNYNSGIKAELKRLSVEEWEGLAGNIVANNRVSPVKYTADTPKDAIRFFYNTTNSVQKYSLAKGQFVDAKNKGYVGTVSVSPYSSLVLFKKDKI